MAQKVKGGLLRECVYFDDERVVRKIKKASEYAHWSVSQFIADAAERAADEAIQERKRLAAERQLGEVAGL